MKIVHFPDQLGVLKAFFDQGMTRRRLPLLAATKTGLSESMVEVRVIHVLYSVNIRKGFVFLSFLPGFWAKHLV
jgi:hypothetical protein